MSSHAQYSCRQAKKTQWVQAIIFFPSMDGCLVQNNTQSSRIFFYLFYSGETPGYLWWYSRILDTRGAAQQLVVNISIVVELSFDWLKETLNCHNPNSTSTQLKSWVWHENDFNPPPGCYNFFHFLSALILNSKFPVRMRYSRINIEHF